MKEEASGLFHQMQVSNRHKYKEFTQEELEVILKELSREKPLTPEEAFKLDPKKYERRKLT